MSSPILVDVGNTTVSWCMADELAHLREHTSLSTQRLLNEQIDLPKVWQGRSLIIASVVPDVDTIIRKIITHQTYFVSKNDFPEITLKLDRPEELGIDRVVNVAAAYRLLAQSPLVVVDFGTATTFDVLNQRQEYIGGVIAPGIGLSRDILNERTAKLPRIEIFRPDHVIGHNTVDAMASGLVRAYEAMVDGILKEIENELGHATQLILTGGYAPLLQIRHPHQILTNLCFMGLEQVSRQMR